MNQVKMYIGIDVAKEHLDVAPFDNQPARVPNNATGIKQLIKRVKATGKTAFLCCEATGGYEQTLLDMACDAGVDIARVNSARVRYFAKSEGHFAKNDKLDAAVITRFAEQKKPAAHQRPTPFITRLQNLLDRRYQLVDFQTQDTNRLHQTSDKESRGFITSTLKHIKEQLAEVDGLIRGLIASDPGQAARAKRLLEVCGIGEVTAAALLGYAPELGRYDEQQITSLGGLAPWADDSGDHRGKRKICGGRAKVRRALYMAAVVAAHHNHVLASFYQGLLKRGKEKKLALTAVMRKLLRLANRLLRDENFQLQTKAKTAKINPAPASE